MKYRIYFLEFLTPVHFADNNFGGDLEKASFIVVQILILVPFVQKLI